MKELNKLENKVASWLKPLPHLPAAAKKWLAVNIWWIQLVGIVILGITGFTILGALILAMGATVTFWIVPKFSTASIFAPFISLLLKFGIIVLMSLAIGPLKNLKKKGWDYLFLALVISAAASVFDSLTSFNASGFISNVLSSAVAVGVGAYFLFEIRSYFVSTK